MAEGAPPVPLSDAEVEEGLRAISASPGGAFYWSVYACFVGGYVWLGAIRWGNDHGEVWLALAGLLAVLPFVAPPIGRWRRSRMTADARRRTYRKRLQQTIRWDAPPLVFLVMGLVMGVLQLLDDDPPQAPFALIMLGMCLLMAVQLQNSRRRSEVNRGHLARLEGEPLAGPPARVPA